MTFGELKMGDLFRIASEPSEVYRKGRRGIGHPVYGDYAQPFIADFLVECVVVVPLADLRSVWVLKPEDAKELPSPLDLGVYIDIRKTGFIVRTPGAIAVTDMMILIREHPRDASGLTEGGEWHRRDHHWHEWHDFSDALAAARAAVDRAKKEAGG